MLIQVASDRFVNANQIVAMEFVEGRAHTQTREVKTGFDAGQRRATGENLEPGVLTLKLANGESEVIKSNADALLAELIEFLGPLQRGY